MLVQASFRTILPSISEVATELFIDSTAVVTPSELISYPLHL